MSLLHPLRKPLSAHPTVSKVWDFQRFVCLGKWLCKGRSFRFVSYTTFLSQFRKCGIFRAALISENGSARADSFDLSPVLPSSHSFESVTGKVIEYYDSMSADVPSRRRQRRHAVAGSRGVSPRCLHNGTDPRYRLEVAALSWEGLLDNISVACRKQYLASRLR